jgi:ubiquinone/menaquinone biosynthesis C-methylase UbiE
VPPSPPADQGNGRDAWDATARARRRWDAVRDAQLAAATELMLDLAGLRAGSRVLVVAAGAGAEALAAARRVGPTGAVLATDVAPGMVRAAAEAAGEAGLTNVEVRLMDAERIDLEPGSFDAVVSRLGLMFFPRLGRALRGVRRVLVPGGRLAAIVYSRPEANPIFSLLAPIAWRHTRARPRALTRLPVLRLGASGVLETAYSRAGFRDARAHPVPIALRLSSAAECLRLIQETVVPITELLAAASEAERRATWAEIAQVLSQFEDAAGFELPGEVLVGIGTKERPGASRAREWPLREPLLDTGLPMDRRAAHGVGPDP